MNFLKIKTSWTNAEFGIFKMTVASAYVLVGAYFHTFFTDHTFAVLIIFAISLVWTMSLWLRKMKKENPGK